MGVKHKTGNVDTMIEILFFFIILLIVSVFSAVIGSCL